MIDDLADRRTPDNDELLDDTANDFGPYLAGIVAICLVVALAIWALY